jgi:hypothetical protein
LVPNHELRNIPDLKRAEKWCWVGIAHSQVRLPQANGFAMRTFNVFCVCICLAGSFSQAAERPTLLKTADPRPDILPRPFYDNHTEYRAQYNRPRFYTGWLAYEVSRTSQEAMVWQENYCAGNYERHHTPPMCKTYYYPKPWEVLMVGARPDFPSAIPNTQRVPPATQKYESEVQSQEDSSNQDNTQPAEDTQREVVPSPSDKTSSRSSSPKPRPVSTKASPARPTSVKSSSFATRLN